jgi:membrane carboxypeptidase/penicillin-binding protein
MSRNVATIKLAELVGYEQVAGMWRRIGVGAPPQGYPSIALGVFEATPYEMAQAYTAFANPGVVQPLRTILRLTHGASRLDVASEAPRRVASAEAAFLVSHMLRAVINEGTAASARGAGLPADAAGKTGTTNDLRDAWFVGFTHDLLTVVWVGFDENQKLGLTGAQAALPIWTSFMSRALAGQPQAPFETPPEIAFVEIDARTGALAPADCRARDRGVHPGHRADGGRGLRDTRRRRAVTGRRAVARPCVADLSQPRTGRPRGVCRGFEAARALSPPRLTARGV